jgi:hypothetical protein
MVTMKIADAREVVLCSLIDRRQQCGRMCYSTQNEAGAAGSSETWTDTYQTTRCPIPEDTNVQCCDIYVTLLTL